MLNSGKKVVSYGTKGEKGNGLGFHSGTNFT
jgi:hypothetical protein